nr:immunoglobulin light chain junction region [Macaca mulatta]
DYFCQVWDRTTKSFIF